MKKVRTILLVVSALCLVCACSLGVGNSDQSKAVKVDLSVTAGGESSKKTKGLVDDTAVASVTVTAEDASGTSLGSATLRLTQGGSSWTGSISFTISAATQVTFRARGWSDVNGAGNLLYYGESTLEVSPDDDSLSVSIGTVLQVLTWTERTNAGSHHWLSIASSSKGDKLAAVEIADDSSSAHTYTSSDYGETWTKQPGSEGHLFVCIASSADGAKLAAGVYGINGKTNGGYIYTSPDSGVTWTERTGAGFRRWQSIASSTDGGKLAAVVDHGYIYTSSDYGETWMEHKTDKDDMGHDWYSIASSADGTKLVAVEYGDSPSVGYIYTSQDSGETWTAQTNAGRRDWYSIASSADGTKLTAVDYNGYIYTSPDSGVTWTQQTNAGSRYWQAIVSSADGRKLAACADQEFIYTASF